MKLWYDRKSKDPTYFVQLCYRNGKKVTTRNIKQIGKHSELLKITDDPLTYAKEVVDKANKENQENQKSGAVSLIIDFDEDLLSSKVRKSHSFLLNTGYLYLQSIYQELNLSKFFDTIVETDKDTFDWNEINRFMTFERILRPASMRSTQLSFDNYYERPDIEYSQILHYLDTLDAHYDDYIAHLFKYRNKLRKSASVCSFYWSGFSSEIEEDEDYVDEVTHEDMLSLRKNGFKAG